ncbi:hypothetical protein FRB93_009724 [Tulasnella sp. JGI-2019a]|nr:hypothetical protein FRB93_009724 [Tulasnella sp. JGI-2019a]
MASCGTGEDAKDEIMPKRKPYDRDRNCLRCRAEPGRIVIRNCVYCKECFYSTVSLKFRKALAQLLNQNEKTKKAKTREDHNAGDLILGFSGGIGSAILLDMVWRRYILDADEKQGIDATSGSEKRRPSVWKKIRVVYVEQCAAYSNLSDRSSEVRRIIDKYPEYQLTVLRIENAFDSTWWTSHGDVNHNSSGHDLGLDISSLSLTRGVPDAPSSPADRLRLYLDSFPTSTAVTHAINTLIRLLLQYFARSTGSSHILLGSSLTSLSVSLISGISQGSGFTVREERDETWEGIRISRPLREIGVKECAAWLWWRGLEVLPKSAIDLSVSREAMTIQRLTGDFIIGLERDYPSTVSAISRTLEKVRAKGESSGCCLLCQRSAQRGVQAWKAKISMHELDSSSVSSSYDQSSFIEGLCYPCHTSLTSRSSRSRKPITGQTVLPMWVTDSAVGLENSGSSPKKMGRAEMRGTISEFLLE